MLAYTGGTNEVLAVECKSLLNSTGLMFRRGRFDPPERFSSSRATRHARSCFAAWAFSSLSAALAHRTPAFSSLSQPEYRARVRPIDLLRRYYNFLGPHGALKFGRGVPTSAQQAGFVTRLSWSDIFMTFSPTVRVLWIQDEVVRNAWKGRVACVGNNS